MSPNIFGSNPERNISFVHRICVSVEEFPDSRGFFSFRYRLFRDLSHSVPVGSGDRKASGNPAERTARPDEGGSRVTSRNGVHKGANGDEGKGNATSVTPQLEGQNRAISANGARAETQARKNTGYGIWMVGLNKNARAEREVSDFNCGAEFAT